MVDIKSQQSLEGKGEEKKDFIRQDKKEEFKGISQKDKDYGTGNERHTHEENRSNIGEKGSFGKEEQEEI